MLALCELLARDALKAWMFGGVAIRQAQALRLGVELHSRQLPREKETRRRVFWACFVMDRLISQTCSRPQMIGLEAVRLQLPCPENVFVFGEDYTGPHIQGVMSCVDRVASIGLAPFFISIFSLWGEIVYFQMRDGRRGVRDKPGDPHGTFSQLETKVDQFQAALPSVMQWSPENYRIYRSTRQGKLFVYLHLLLNHAKFAMHQEYLPQQDGPMYATDNGIPLQAEYDGAGVSLDYTDERLISTCISSSNAIADLVSMLFTDGDELDRQTLQSTVALHPIMAAAAVQLWAQHARQQDDPDELSRYKAQFELFSQIIHSWKSQWSVASAWMETLDAVRRLYESSYVKAWSGAAFPISSTHDIDGWPEAGDVNVTLLSPPDHEGRGNGHASEVAEGSGLPDPEQVCQRLFDKIRYTMLVSLEAPDVKRRMLNSYLRTLWIHVWRGTAMDDFFFEDRDFPIMRGVS